MTTPAHDIITNLARRLDELPHGEKRAEVLRVAGVLGWTAATVYSHLKKVGWSSGRKKRADAGRTAVDDRVLLDLSTVIKTSVRENGKVLMGIPNAASVLAANHREIPVGNAQLGRLLRTRRMSARHMKQASPATEMQSLHPNHVHQVDPSYCVLYYLPKKDGSAESFIQRIARDDELYQNKPDNFAKISAYRVWRYVLTDHFSGTVMVRYYQSAGESVENLYDFLLWCWSRQPNRPFHGVPKLLMWDKGSANTSHSMKFALDALDVDDIPHATGNARTKGQVENGNNLVETLFESRLRLEPVSSVEELNAAAERWCVAYNANAIPHYDSRLKRKRMALPQARFALWQMIRQEQLRILPELDLCRWLLHGKAEQRVVSAKLTISFRHPGTKRSHTYDLRDLPEVYPGVKVEVAPLVYGEGQVKVTVRDYRDEACTFTVAPVVFNDLSGFRVDAPVIGEEFQAHRDTVQDQAQKAADRNAFPGVSDEEIDKLKRKNAAPFGGLNAHSHLADVYTPAFLVRPGTAIEVEGANRLEARPIPTLEVLKRIRATLQRDITAEESRLIRERFPKSVPHDEFDQLVDLIRNPPEERKAALSLVK